MTLNLLTQIPEGLVMLCDSTVSSWRDVDGEMERISFQHARKLFHLGSAPAAAMINGAVNIGSLLLTDVLRRASRTIEGLDRSVDHDTCVSILSEAVSAEFAKSASEKPPATMLIVGSHFDKPKATAIEWPGPVRTDIINDLGSGLWFWGSGSSALIRLVKGVDFDILATPVDGSDDERVGALHYFEKNDDLYSMRIALELMPIQQAIYFSEFLAKVASGFDRFSIGPHTVGGEVDVVALVGGQLKWIHKQRLASSFTQSDW